MQRLVPSLLIVLLFAPLGLSDDKSAKDLKKMDGTWKIAAEKVGDVTLTKEQLQQLDAKLTIEKGKFTMHFAKKLINQGEVKLDASKSPQTIDIVVKQGEGKGETLKGLYQFKNDKLIVIVAESGARPKKFETTKEKPYVLITYERVKK